MFSFSMRKCLHKKKIQTQFDLISVAIIYLGILFFNLLMIDSVVRAVRHNSQSSWQPNSIKNNNGAFRVVSSKRKRQTKNKCARVWRLYRFQIGAKRTSCNNFSMRPFTIWRVCGECGMRLCVWVDILCSFYFAIPSSVRHLKTFEIHFICGFRPMLITFWFYFLLLFSELHIGLAWMCEFAEWITSFIRWDYIETINDLADAVAITHHITSLCACTIKIDLMLSVCIFLESNCFSRHSWCRRCRHTASECLIRITVFSVMPSRTAVRGDKMRCATQWCTMLFNGFFNAQ